MSKPLDVAICVPVHDKIEPLFWRSISQLEKIRAPEGLTRLIDIVGRSVDEARMMLTQDALAAPVTHILMVDDDMVFPPHAMRRLLSWGLDIVGGLCHNRRSPYQPILAKEFGTGWSHPPGSFGWCYEYPKDVRFEVEATGAAFLLVKREVYEAVAKKYGTASWWDSIDGLPEDFSFCKKARACGFKVHVDTGLEIGHQATVTVDSVFAAKNREQQWMPWYPFAPLEHSSKPVATVVIPVFNQKPELLNAAVHSAAWQTVPTEVIVVDDGSTPAVVRGAWPEHVKLIRHEKNRGIAVALNTGIEAMGTEWFGWLSSDDLYDPRKIATTLAALGQSGLKAAFGPYNMIEKSGRVHQTLAPAWSSLREQQVALARGCAIFGSTAVIHRSVFEDVGRFNPSYRYGQDWEMWCRIGRKYRWHTIKDVLTSRREYDNLTSRLQADETLRKIAFNEDEAIRNAYALERCATCGQEVER